MSNVPAARLLGLDPKKRYSVTAKKMLRVKPKPTLTIVTVKTDL